MGLNAGFVYRDVVRSEHAGARVLAYHVERFPHSTTDEWRRAIDDGRVLVNARAASSEQVLRAGDRLEFHRAPWSEPDAPLHFEVAFEDDDVLVVDKPAGLQVLPAGPFTASTLLHVVQSSAPSRANAAPVHRLGRGTSGLILLGKSAEARAFLTSQFRDRRARKTYLALASGTALPDSCIARHPIGTRAHGPLVIHCVERDGKPAITRLRVLARDRGADRMLVAAQPITGRADQIRIHLAACGAPIVGDPLFGPGGTPISDARPGDGGYFLHSTSIGVIHPSTGLWLKVRSRPAWS